MDEDALRTFRHDLRSPLVVIGGFAQLLGREGELAEADRRAYAERIVAAVSQLESLIDERV